MQAQPLWIGHIANDQECSFEALEGLVYPDFARQTAADAVPALTPNVGGIDFGYRNPFAAVWGVVDADGVLWLTGERYRREQTVHEHARHLPPRVTWYADPAGAAEIAALRQLGLVVRRGANDLRAGIAAVRARLEAGKLKVAPGACPELLAETQLYSYPTAADRGDVETPVDAHNHALAALRYLVARLDHDFIKRYQRRVNDSPITNGERGVSTPVKVIA
jgi:hypothetical protein